MANSFVSTIAAAGQTTFPFNFPNGYLHEDHIKVFVDGTETARTISSGSAVIAACEGGEEVVVARQSPQTPYISFEDGSILNKQNIDVQNKHAFMIAEEAAEQRDFFALGDIDMNYHKIIHVAPGTDQYDVVNKGQFDYFLYQTEADRLAAEEAALNASASETNAANSEYAAAQSQAAAAASAAEAEAIADGLVAEGDAQVARVVAEGDTQDARVTAEGDTQDARVEAEGNYQFGRAKAEADRAELYAEILERPFEDMGGHTIQQGYPPIPSFSSMWYILDGGVDPSNPAITWNVGDYLVYSIQTAAFSRLAGESVLPGPPQPIEILDDLIMQQGKKIRFMTGETSDTTALTVDVDGDVVVGEIPTTASTDVPNAKAGITARDGVFVITGTDADNLTEKFRVYAENYKPTPAAIGAAPTGFGIGGPTVNPPSNDLDLITGSGLYSVSSATLNTPGAPESGSTVLAMVWGSADGSQTHFGRNSKDVFYRIKASGAWSSWHRLYTTENKPTAADIGALGNTGAQTLAGALSLETAAPIFTLRETDTGNAFLLVADGSGARFQRTDTAGTEIWSVSTSDHMTVRDPHTSTAQGTAGNALARKDYVDGAFRSKHAGNLGAGSDWNGILTPGAYTVALFGANAPVGTYDYGVVTVEGNGTITTQWYIPDSPTERAAFRSTYSGSGGWRAWQYVPRAAYQIHTGGGSTTSATFTRLGNQQMATVVLTMGGKNYPLTLPLIHTGSYWISRWGGESADRDYSFGLTVSISGDNVTLTAQKGQYAASNPAISQIHVW